MLLGELGMSPCAWYWEGKFNFLPANAPDGRFPYPNIKGKLKVQFNEQRNSRVVWGEGRNHVAVLASGLKYL